MWWASLALIIIAYIWWQAIRYPRMRYRINPEQIGSYIGHSQKNPAFCLGGILKLLIAQRKAKWPTYIIKTRTVKPVAKIAGSTLKLTFINHSSFLIQTHGLNILTDPIWSKRASPFGFIGPRRYREPGVAFEQLPKIDLVLISHDHYDHLDLPYVQKLIARDNPSIYMGRGCASYFKKSAHTHELAWWEQRNFHSGLRINFVPAKHFSGRYLFERNSTLWGGFVLEFGHENLLFMGDTGMGDFVYDLKARFQHFKLALIPIGAYEPRWFMSEIHLNPQEAVAVHQILKPETSVAMHFGTFPLASEGYMQAERAFGRAAAGISNFIIPHNGQEITL